MLSFLHEIRETYRQSKKPRDIAWNVYVARPLAAVLVYLLRRTALTPNQVTFLGLATFVAAAAVLVVWEGAVGFLVAALVVQLAYLFDCVDGQLARIKEMTSEVGAYLDFLMDELKAMMLVGAASLRLWYHDEQIWVIGGEHWLLVGMGAVFLVASATSLTTFIRRPAYAGEQIDPGESARRDPMPESLVGKAVWAARQTASYFVHYPSWIIWVAAIGFFAPVDTALLFLVPYLGVYLVYLAQTALGVVWKLGRPGFYD